ncbi:MAG: hypothetical protein WBK08_17365 [Nitrospira sp.]|jgi:hypothetical protein|nr:MAG: hypothetical protein E8D42_11640 [Nitrospira sp.]
MIALALARVCRLGSKIRGHSKLSMAHIFPSSFIEIPLRNPKTDELFDGVYDGQQRGELVVGKVSDPLFFY